MTNRWLKLLSIFLSLVLIFNLLPLQVLASNIDDTPPLQLSTLPEDGSSGSITGYQRLDTATVVEEDTSRRGEYHKEFVLNNGLRLAAVYADPVHYQENGQWKDIDNTLKVVSVKGVAGYTNTAGVWQVYFPQQLTGSNAISLTKDGYTVSFGMAGELTNSGNIAVASIGTATDTLAVSSVRTSAAQVRAVDLTEQKAAAQYEQTVLEKHHSKLAYSSVYDNTEIVYDLTGNRLKESIVLSKYDASLWGYRYNLNTGGLVPVLLEDNTIELRHPETTEVVMTMPAPFMVDANYEYSYDVDVSLVSKNGGYLLSYYVPRAWLASPDRVWPVVLDPVVEAENEQSNIQDIAVSENRVYTNNENILRAGYGPYAGILRSYLRYKTLPSLTSASVIVNAKLTMTKLADSTVGASIEVHKVNTEWQASGMTWANKPAFNNNVEDVVFVKGPQAYTWDITNIALDWYSSVEHALGDNTGLMFKATDEIEKAKQDNWQSLCSSDGSAIPQLEITYQDTAGLEDYWDYSSVSAGRAGTGYIHNHSGNLVWVHNDMGFDGNRMPVSISHIFNSRDSSSNAMGLGYGWRTNYNQLLNYQLNTTNNTRYYIWEDGDGTEHYFYEVTTEKYQDEDGLDLTMDVLSNESGYTEQKYSITDKLGNKSYFDTWGRLTSQASNQRVNLDNDSATSSIIRVKYADTDSSISRRISQITDGAGRVYMFTYNSKFLLRCIEYKGKSQTQSYYSVLFDYDDDNGILVEVSYLDGKTVGFTYTSKNLLSTVTDVDGYTLTFEYNTTDAGKPSRIKSVADSHGSTNGSTTNFSYGYCSTKITTPESTRVHFFNQWSNTISVQDDQGRGTFQEYTPVLAQGDYKNQLTGVSAQQVSVGNMFLDSSFEYNTLWTNAGCSNLSISSSTAYIGGKSMSFKGGGVQSGPFHVKNGESITFSAYLKSDNLPHAELELNTVGTSLAKSQPLSDSDSWERLSVTYTNKSGSTQTVYAIISMNSMTTVYVDCVQLEKDANANHYNLVQNGDFSADTDWNNLTSYGSGTGVITVTYPAAPQLDSKALKVTGDPDQTRVFSQTIPINGKSQDTFVLSGWAKAPSLPLEGKTQKIPMYALQVTFNHGVTSNTQQLSFQNLNATQWQYGAKQVKAANDFTSITISLIYTYTAGTAYFDGICLYQGRLGDSYTYENGNLTKHEDVIGNVTTYDFDQDSVDPKEVYYPTGTKMAYTYESGTHNVLTAQEYGFTGSDYVLKSTTTYTYDGYGNVTATSCVTNEGVDSIPQTTSAVYTEDKNHLAEYTDETGAVTEYGYDEDLGLLKWIRYPGDTAATQTEYKYDTMFRPVEVSARISASKIMSANYAYANDNVSQISTPTTVYSLGYGAFGQRTSVSVGSRQLAQYTYNEDYAKRDLEKLAYGNGDVVKYEYDSKGRVIEEKYWNTPDTTVDPYRTVTYTYNARGLLATKSDSVTQMTTRYVYDAYDRLIHTNNQPSHADNQSSQSYDQRIHAAKYSYDNLGNVIKAKEAFGTTTTETEYRYDGQNRPYLIVDNTTTVMYVYDNLNRVTGQTVGLTGATTVESVITYKPNSNRIHTLTVGGTTYTYDYDAKGNIRSVSGGGNNVSYLYDSQNQLIRENNQAAGRTWTWAYDEAGNIQNKKEYAYTTGTLGAVLSTITYGYTNEQWGDLLTSYNGKTITYDEIGNPLSDGTWNYTWKQGRQLAQMSKGATTWQYTYDDEGLRTQRTDGEKIYNYIYSGGLLRYMEIENNGVVQHRFVFRYGADGRPYSVRFDGTDYFYVLNLQGDVIGIVDSNGVQEAGYAYDAWGNLTPASMIAPGIGTLNPLRYRGYVYDQETGLYYLQSRYYNPQWGRFINADDVELLAANGDFASLNLFAYCGNNPVSRDDPNGGLWVAVGLMAVGGLIGAAISAVSSAVTQQALTGTVNWKSVGVAAASGFVSGAVAASPLGVVGQQIAGGVIGGLSYAADCYVNDKAMKLDEAILSVGMGVVSGRIGGPGANEKMVLSNAAKSAKQTIARESRRANQQYAQKVIAATISSRNNTFASSAWAASFRFAAGTGISNGVTGKYSSLELFPNAPTWKPW